MDRSQQYLQAVCAVALPNGHEVELTETIQPGSPVTVTGHFSRMAVYGCVQWGHNITRDATGKYIVDKYVFDQSTTDDQVALKYDGFGIGPSDTFVSLLE